MGFTATSTASTLQAGSNLSQTIGNAEKIMRLGNMFLGQTYTFNSKQVDGASVGPGFTI